MTDRTKPTIKNYLSMEQVQALVAKVAMQLHNHYDYVVKENEQLVVIVVLNGAMPFAVDVMRMAGVECRIESIKASSSNGMHKGELEIIDLLSKPVREVDHVLIIEDIVDTGHTMQGVIRHVVENYAPQSIKVATLLDKPSKREVVMVPDFVGKQIGDMFVIGYGLDLDGLYRNNDAIVRVVSEVE